MAISNTYVLELDLKRQMTARVPRFRTGDNGILIMQVFDDGIEYNMNSVTKAELYHKTAGCNTIKSECEIITYEGKIAVKYEYEKVAMIDKGLSLLMLVLYEDDVAISVQPFTVQVYDDLIDGINSFTELIQSLQKIIDELNLEIKNAIPLSEKGVPNGVATLDSDGSIPLEQLPSEVNAYFDHIEQTVWKDKVHGLQFDDDGLLMYRTDTGLQYVGFSPTGAGGGMQLLDVLITKSNGVVTLTFVGTPHSVLQKWSIGDKPKIFFTTGGTTFTGRTIEVTNTGLHTLYYKDSNGTEYTRLFNVDISDLPVPDVTVDTVDGIVTVTIDADIAIKKWAKGKQNIGYFQSQGIVFTGNSFNVTETGWYTIYYKTTTGVEYIYEFEVTSGQLTQLDATVSFGTNSSTTYMLITKNPTLTNNTGGTVQVEAKWTDDPNPEVDGIKINQQLQSGRRQFIGGQIQYVNTLIPSNTPIKAYYHAKLTQGSASKWVTEEVNLGYTVSSSTSTLSSLSEGDAFRIDGYDDGHFVKLTSGSSNIKVMHVPSTNLTTREWGITDDKDNNGYFVGYGFQMDAGIGQYLNNEYYNQLPTTLKNNIITSTFKQKNPIGDVYLDISAKVGLLEDTFAINNTSYSSILGKSGIISAPVLATRPYPDRVFTYGAVWTSLSSDELGYTQNANIKDNIDTFAPVFVISSGSSVSVKKVTNQSSGILR